MTDDLSKLNGAVGSAVSIAKQTWFICTLLWVLQTLCAFAMVSGTGISEVRDVVVSDMRLAVLDGLLGWIEETALPILQNDAIKTAVQLTLAVLALIATYEWFKDGRRTKPLLYHGGDQGEDYGALVAGLPIMLRTATAFLLAATADPGLSWWVLGITLGLYWIGLAAGERKRRRQSLGSALELALIVILAVVWSIFYIPLAPLLALGSLMSSTARSNTAPD